MEEQRCELVSASSLALKHWEEPAIVLERSLEVSAQGGPPTGPSGFLGPLGQSGNAGTCMSTGG